MLLLPARAHQRWFLPFMRGEPTADIMEDRATFVIDAVRQQDFALGNANAVRKLALPQKQPFNFGRARILARQLGKNYMPLA